MTTPTSVDFPIPRDWQQFEGLACALFSAEYNQLFQRWGRGGQRQNGVDVFSRLDNGKLILIQCKGRSTNLGSKLKIDDINKAVAEVDTFPHEASEFFILTTGKDDKALQSHALSLSEQRAALGKSAVHIWGWGTICDHIGQHKSVQRTFYGAWFQKVSLWQWFSLALFIIAALVVAVLFINKNIAEQRKTDQHKETSIQQLLEFVQNTNDLITAYSDCDKLLTSAVFTFSSDLRSSCTEPTASKVARINRQIELIAPVMDRDAWNEMNALTSLMGEDYRQGIIAVEMTVFFEDAVIRAMREFCPQHSKILAGKLLESAKKDSGRDAIINQLHYFFLVKDFILPSLEAMKAIGLVHARRLAGEEPSNELIGKANLLRDILKERGAFTFQEPAYPLTISAIKSRASRNIKISGENDSLEQARWSQVIIEATMKSFHGRGKDVDYLISCGVFKPNAKDLIAN